MALQLSKRYFELGKLVHEDILLSDTGVSREEMKNNFEKFNEYEEENYSTEPLKCLCGNDDSYKISEADREGNFYPLVICNSCGLIRAKDYWKQEFIEDFYKNRYRQKYEGGKEPKEKTLLLFFEAQKAHSKQVYQFVKDFIGELPQPFETFDIGGGAGGMLDSFKEISNCTVFDFDTTFLNIGSKNGFKTLEGGIEDIKTTGIKPDFVILSHVIEHIPDLNKVLEGLASSLKSGSLVYIEVPSIDGLTNGAYYYDFLRHIHKPHVYYFSVGVLNNLMQRHGFDVLKVNHNLSGLYQFNNQMDERVRLRNCHDEVVSLIKNAETKRKFRIIYIYYFLNKVKSLLNKIFKLNLPLHSV
tara:strand:+ start:253 stop:1323 length:1071 start_codon:yes stop_codon:yes gene_type:complete